MNLGVFRALKPSGLNSTELLRRTTSRPIYMYENFRALIMVTNVLADFELLKQETML